MHARSQEERQRRNDGGPFSARSIPVDLETLRIPLSCGSVSIKDFIPHQQTCRRHGGYTVIKLATFSIMKWPKGILITNV